MRIEWTGRFGDKKGRHKLNSRSSLVNLSVFLKCKLWGCTSGKKQYEKTSADSRARLPGLKSWLCLFLAEYMHAKLLQSCPTLHNPWRTAARQVPLSLGFSRQEYWSGLSFPTPGDLPDPGIEPAPLTSPALAGGFFITSAIMANRWGNSGNSGWLYFSGLQDHCRWYCTTKLKDTYSLEGKLWPT